MYSGLVVADFDFNIILAIVVGMFLHISTTIIFETSENHKFNFDDALKWLNLYELNNSKDQQIDYAKFLIDLNQNDNLNTVINFLSDGNFNFDQINTQSSQESFQVLIDFLKMLLLFQNYFNRAILITFLFSYQSISHPQWLKRFLS